MLNEKEIEQEVQLVKKDIQIIIKTILFTSLFMLSITLIYSLFK